MEHMKYRDALDYIVSVEAVAFLPGFDNDGYGWPDFSSLMMGNLLYRMASSRTFRPDRLPIQKEIEAQVGAHVATMQVEMEARVQAEVNSRLQGLMEELCRHGANLGDN